MSWHVPYTPEQNGPGPRVGGTRICNIDSQMVMVPAQ